MAGGAPIPSLSPNIETLVPLSSSAHTVPGSAVTGAALLVFPSKPKLPLYPGEPPPCRGGFFSFPVSSVNSFIDQSTYKGAERRGKGRPTSRMGPLLGPHHTKCCASSATGRVPPSARKLRALRIMQNWDLGPGFSVIAPLLHSLLGCAITHLDHGHSSLLASITRPWEGRIPEMRSSCDNCMEHRMPPHLGCGKVS